MARNYMDVVALLPPELQQQALERQAEFEPLLDRETMPVVSDAQIGTASGSWRGDKAIGMTQDRLARALASQQGAQSDLMAGISGPKYAPSAWGPIAVRQSPLMNVVKAIRAYKGGRDVAGTEGELSGLYDAEKQRLEAQLGAFRDQNLQANQQGNKAASDRLMRALMSAGGR